MKLKIFIILLCVYFSPATWAETNSYVQQLQNKAAQDNLWKQPEWMNLLHYRKVDSFDDPFESSVDDDAFFLSPTGKNNSKLELNATLAAFFGTKNTGNEHALCRFVARFSWLSSHLEIDKSRLPAVDCSDYVEWRDTVKSEKVTLVFPAYHLNSPSSMYGHTLLRLDPKDGDEWSDWLSYAVNFGANVSSDDNSLAYAFKGLTGGYPGQFIVAPYFKKILEYSRIERRDIWEYELNLTPEEVERLVQHLWELKDINFDYYFFTENCSYRLLELIEVARPSVELTDEFLVTAIPVDTVRAVQKVGLIEKTKFRPSRETVLKSMIDTLTPEEKTVLTKLVESSDVMDSNDFSSMSEDRQLLLSETAYKLLRFRQNRKVRNQSVAKKSHQLLSKINSYPVGSEISMARPVEPEKSHHSKQWAFKVGERDDKNFTELGFRMSFHSLEDNELGFLRGAQINIASVRFRLSEENTLFLQKLDFVDIFSLTPRTEFFDPYSWRVRTGMERVYREDGDHLVSHVSGGGGFAWDIIPGGMGYTLMTGRIEGNEVFDDHVEPALGAVAGLLLHNSFGTGRLELGGEKFTGGMDSTSFEYKQNFIISTDHAIRLSFKREWYEDKQFSEVGLSYLLHF